MKHLLHIPTEAYGFIEQEFEGEPADAVAAYSRLKHFATDGPGVGAREFAKIVHEYVTTGVLVNGGNTYGDYSVGQKAFLAELTKLNRKK